MTQIRTISATELFLRRVWAMGHLFLMLLSTPRMTPLTTGSLDAVLACSLMLAILGVLWHPSTRWTALLMVSQIAFALVSLPDLPNHRYLLAFSNIGLLLLYRDGSFFHAESRWFTSRTLAVVYFFAVFHKLNSGFFDPSISCGTVFLNNIRAVFPLFPNVPQWLPLFTVAIESLFVVLLLSPRTWPIAAALAFIFHAGLTFDYAKLFINFTGVMVALFGVTSVRVYSPNMFLQERLFRGVVLFVPVLLICGVSGITPPWLFIFGTQILLLFWMAALGVLVLQQGKFQEAPGLSREGLIQTLPRTMNRTWVASCVVSALLINGAAPYLGIKNRGSFNMYSNLVITPSYSNHFIVRRSLDPFSLNGEPLHGFWGRILPSHRVTPESASECLW